jgi:putative endonuclease
MISNDRSGWRAYHVRCSDGSIYAGATNDVVRRIAAHNAGHGARYTRARRPVALVWRSPRLGKSAAHRLEARLKRIARIDKLALVGPATMARRHLVRALLVGLRP